MTKGLNEILQKFHDVKAPGVEGLTSGALFIKAESMKICPVDTTNLIAGAYADIVEETLNMVTAEIGYQADYAPYVHEAPEDTNWQKPKAENKFLEKPIMRNEKKILGILGADVGSFIR